ncbi:MAG: orotidine-5'-phosphate decarboxylase [Promethearchaeota archaeon]
MFFIEKLIQSIRDKKSVVCMGLDPRMDGPGQIPEDLIKELEDPNKIILEFNKTLIENVHDLIPVIKPQIAFYEKYEAYEALKETIKYAHKKDLLVILDSKRNDIGSTSEAYAYSNFKVYNADACTINAYLGIDGVKPFLKHKDKGVFILVKTSNPSSNDFQNLFSVRLDDIQNSQIEFKTKSISLERNYIQMAKLIQVWSKSLEIFSDFNNLGAVVGATFPEELKIIRDILRNSFILIPGYGAQGAQAKDIKAGFNKKGLGAIVNSSRGIMFAYNKRNKSPEKYAEAAKQEIIEMNEKINKEIGLL